MDTLERSWRHLERPQDQETPVSNTDVLTSQIWWNLQTLTKTNLNTKANKKYLRVVEEKNSLNVERQMTITRLNYGLQKHIKHDKRRNKKCWFFTLIVIVEAILLFPLKSPPEKRCIWCSFSDNEWTIRKWISVEILGM